MALKYFIEYEDVINITHRFNIYDDTFAGVATQIDGSIILNYSETDDPLEAIRGQGLSVQLEASESMTFSDLWNEGEKGLRVDYTRDSIILFKGWLNPEGFFENYVSTNWLITFVCVDGIGYLKDLSFVDNNGFPITGKKTYLEILSIALKRTGLLQNIYADIQIRYTGLSESLDTLDNTFANTERYVKDDGETIMSCDDVIRDVLEPFGAVLTAFKGDWYIYKPNQLFSNSTPVFYAYDSDGIALIPGTVAIDISETIGSSINGFVLHHCSENQQINNKNSLGAYRINYKYGLATSLALNKNFYTANGTSYDGWVINTPAKVIIPASGESGVKILTNITDLFAPYVLRSENADVLSGIVLDLSISYTLVNIARYGFYFFSFRYSITLNTGSKYYYYNNIENVWTTVLFLCSSVSANGYGNTLNFSTAPIPENGILNINFFSVVADENGGYASISEVSLVNRTEAPTALKGEFHTFERLTKPSSKVKANKEVSTGDNPSNIYEGTIYKRDVIFVATPILTFISATVDSVSFSWNPIEGSIGYKVYKDGVFSHTVIANVGSFLISSTLTGLTASTSYNVQVLAYNSIGDGTLSPIVAMSTTASGTTSTTPTALTPRLITRFTYTLDWDAPTAFGTVDGYYVYQNGIKTYNEPSASTSLDLIDLTEGETNIWEVSAYDASLNESPKSAPLAVKQKFLLSTDDELQYLQYPSTIDAPPLTSGKVLSTDVEGKLALYTLPVVDSEVWVIAFSDETTPITTGVKKVEFQMPNYATTLVDVSVSFRTAPTTSTITIDLNEAGVSVLSTKLTVDATEKTSETAAIPRVISDTALAANAVMTIDVDSADTGGTSTGGKLMLYWKKL